MNINHQNNQEFNINDDNIPINIENDPELAMAIKMSLEEEKLKKEKEE